MESKEYLDEVQMRSDPIAIAVIDIIDNTSNSSPNRELTIVYKSICFTKSNSKCGVYITPFHSVQFRRFELLSEVEIL